MALPQHIGIIMDGNGRWAKAQGKQRIRGHQEGLKAAKAVVKRARERNIPYLSLYAFSTENWQRAEEEVSFLMGLIAKHLKREYDFYRREGVRVVHSGNLELLPTEVQKEIRDVSRDTADFKGITVNLLINYGGRDSVLRAVQRWQKDPQKRELSAETLRTYFDQPEIPDADLIIRSAGEQRLSNFLLWEGAYAELVFSPKLWPDFSGEDLDKAIEEYQGRERRFGGAEE